MLKWKVETRKLSELKAYEKNPRRITEKGLNDLIKSLELFGLAEPIVVNLDNTIIGGHARVQALKRIKGKARTTKVDVYVPDRLLTEDELRELLVRLNKNVAGSWDFDMLANDYEPRDLISWGFDQEQLGISDGPQNDEPGDSESQEDKPVKPQIIHCPNCDHQFSVVERQKGKKS
jgi:ParB-like chromosome segregation protein Spo0J